MAATPGPASIAEPPARVRAARGAGLVRAAFENVEALAIAVVMALILKYFLIEAYKIPTGSMQPQIMGDQVVGISDRVLVNELVYLMRDPERYEVVVFRNPLWQRQNYIKRLVAFGGERVCIRNGDLFITPRGAAPEAEHIARKPDSVWRAVRKDLLPTSAPLSQTFETEGHARFADRDVLLEPAKGATASIRTRTPVKDHYLDGYHPKWVAAYLDPTTTPFVQKRYAHVGMENVTDVEFSVDVTPKAGAQAFFVEIHEAGRVHRLELPVGTGSGSLVTQAGASSFEPEGEAAPLPALAAGSSTRVSLRNVDDELVVEIDGAVALRRPYVTRGIDPDGDPTARDGGARVVAGASGGTVELADVGLWRDIHYLPDGNVPISARSSTYTVPDGEFMVLGDNTQNSWDCRQWVAATVKLSDGRSITGNYFNKFGNTPDSNPDYAGPGANHFRNVFGQDFVFPRDDERGDYVRTDVHSVPERMLLGKALAVFWPLPPFSPTWRLKWVR